MKQEKWTQQLRNKLADHEEAAPADLWAGIEAKLAQQAAPEKRPRIIPLWGRWAAAAAVIACMMLGAGYLMQQEDNQELTASVKQQSIIKGVEPMTTDQSSDIVPTETTAKKVGKTLVAQINQVKAVVDALIPSEPAQTEQLVAQSQVAEQKVTEQSPAVSEPEQEGQAPKTKSSENRPSLKQTLEDNEEAIRQLDEKIAEEMKRSRSHANFGLYAANGFGNQMNSNGVVMNPMMAANYNQSNYLIAGTRSDDSNLINLAGYEEQQKHNQPISFGLSTNIPISSKFSVVTGLVYTRLSSEFTKVMPSLSVKTEQTLHYIGIPVNVQYLIWDYKGFKMYASAGGQIDYNVKADMKTAGVDVELERDRLQFSAQGALGIQYDFIPMLGVYVEPGLKYYFDNGSNIRNFFKDKPTNFNVQVGVRFNLAND